MGAVDTASPRPLKLSLQNGVVRCWDPDNNATTTHAGWDGYLMDFEYKTNADHSDERFRKPEIILKLHDGERESLLAVRLGSFAFRQFACAIENANLRQPITFRIWGYDSDKIDEKTGKPVRNTGGINLWQGDVQIAEKYTDKNLNGMPAVTKETDQATLEEVRKGVPERMMFLRNILDNVIRPNLQEIAAMGAWEEAPKHIGPMVPQARLEQPVVRALPPSTDATVAGAAPRPEGIDENDGMPF